MIISRTPFRISFFGGGTDYPVWYDDHPGAVLSVTINKYCYITCRYLPPFFDHKHRIIYSRSELVRDIKEIKHPAVRGCLEFLGVTDGIEIHHDGDLPARTGIGSSSAFTVGLLNSLYALKGKMVSKRQLARDAIHVEQNILRESVGSQDQIASSFGGFNLIEFGGGRHFEVYPLTVHTDRLRTLKDHLMLFFTGFSRNASRIASEQIRKTHEKTRELTEMHGMVKDAMSIISSNASLLNFGKLLHEAWRIKRTITGRISTEIIDSIYKAARSAGATGGKLLGAGGGGFMLFFVPPAKQSRVRSRLKRLLHVPFSFDNSGSQIIFYTPDNPYGRKILKNIGGSR
ncbi:MAG: kinase [Candidatus Omnitrophica bacterium]|nr:kinase [Candidatus Omnitrophota bacterium]